MIGWEPVAYSALAIAATLGGALFHRLVATLDRIAERVAEHDVRLSVIEAQR